MTSSGSWDRFLNQFFYYGDQANKKLKNGLLNQETLFAISDFITRILSNIAFFPARLQIIFKEIGPAVKEFFSKLQEDPTIKGFFAIFRKIGEMESKASANEIRNRALIDLEKKGFITRAESISASAGYPSESTQKLLDQFMMIQNMRKNQPTKLEGMFTQLNAVSEKQRKYFELESARNRAAIKGLSDKGLEVKGTGKVTLPGTMLGDPTEVEKDKKVKEKQTRALDIIAINTQKANELTLRNMTYGGGVLASQGISEAQMARNRSVKSPQISATNDISRGVEKMIRSYNNSNNLNFSFRRA
jgi:hypothetical protein